MEGCGEYPSSESSAKGCRTFRCSRLRRGEGEDLVSAAGGEFSADELAEGMTASNVERGDGVNEGKRSAICRVCFRR